jgi:hypothetical protein
MADGLGFDAEFGQAGEQILLGRRHGLDITAMGKWCSRAGLPETTPTMILANRTPMVAFQVLGYIPEVRGTSYSSTCPPERPENVPRHGVCHDGPGS